MSIAMDKEQVVAGYLNLHQDNTEFTLSDINQYVVSLWNAGCGPIRLNYTQQELQNYLDSCDGLCLRKTLDGYVVDKANIDYDVTEEERAFFKYDKEKIKSYALFCRLKVDLRTPEMLLDAMGFHFFMGP